MPTVMNNEEKQVALKMLDAIKHCIENNINIEAKICNGGIHCYDLTVLEIFNRNNTKIGSIYIDDEHVERKLELVSKMDLKEDDHQLVLCGLSCNDRTHTLRECGGLIL